MSVLWTANDPFVGKWKLDIFRSLIVDQMQVEVAGPNKFTFRFEGGPPETIAADGTDQPGYAGTNLSVTRNGARGLNVVRKKSGHVLLTAIWQLSQDGQSLRDDFTNVNSDGSTFTIRYLYRRKSGTSDFAGLWESTTPPVGLTYELQIQPYGGQGLSFIVQSAVKNVTFDGRDHAVAGPVEGASVSGRRPSERAIEVTNRVGGKISDKRTYRLSNDGKTLTVTVHPSGQTTPNVLVLARE
jgi:hypothetical protein